MKTVLAVADRTAVLFLGLAVGGAMGFAFADAGGDGRPPPLVPRPPIALAGPDSAPPPPTGATPTGRAPAGAIPAGARRPPIVTPASPHTASPAGPRLRATLATGAPIRIGVYGDSFGDGVWSGLHRELPGRRGYVVTKYSQQATGFTRYKRLNLETHLAAQVARDPVDIAVVSYGANDTQGVIADGHLAAYMTPAWQGLIARRAAGLVRVLRDSGATVYWVGLPRMRDGGFDADIGAMNAFYARLMAELGVPFIDTRPMSSGPAGFAAYLPDRSGKPILMRAEDGIHMSMNGYVRITRGLAQRIDAQVTAARAGPADRGVPPRPPGAARYDMGATR